MEPCKHTTLMDLFLEGTGGLDSFMETNSPSGLATTQGAQQFIHLSGCTEWA